MNQDFVEMLVELSDAGVRFLVIEEHAVAVYGRPRATGALDIWVEPTHENSEHVWEALVAFGTPLHEVTREDLTSDDVVFQIGVSPDRIDILTTLGGVSFDEAWPRRTTVPIGELEVPIIGLEDLIRSKKAVGRPRDLADVAELEGLAES